ARQAGQICDTQVEDGRRQERRALQYETQRPQRPVDDTEGLPCGEVGDERRQLRRIRQNLREVGLQVGDGVLVAVEEVGQVLQVLQGRPVGLPLTGDPFPVRPEQDRPNSARRRQLEPPPPAPAAATAATASAASAAGRGRCLHGFGGRLVGAHRGGG